jgi:hypothetical protein
VAKRSKPSRKRRSVSISIDLSALEKLYKRRYEVSLDGGDTKAGSVKIHDGDTKGGLQIRDGDTKGGGRLPKRPSRKVRRKS